MSNIYALAPQTSGKVVLHTTVGDVEIELWSKETPKACRNFVQLCMEKYYDGCTFYRIVKDFIVQTGDPTGEGGNGESAYGKPFPNEIHSRLRFNHRGIVAMVNGGSNKNTSEFFITIVPNAEHLNGKNTIFGKIVGDTIFNVMKMNDFDMDEDGRPEFPAKIISTEILWDPFEDIIPRASMLQKRKSSKPTEEETKKKRAKTAKKLKNALDMKLLSFAGDEDEEEEAIAINTQKLANSNQQRKRTEKKKRMNTTTKPLSKKITTSEKEPPRIEGAEDLQQSMLEKMRQKQKTFEAPVEKEIEKKTLKKKDESKRKAILLLEQERMKYKKKQTLSKSVRQKKAMDTLAMFNSTLREQLESASDMKSKVVDEDDANVELMYDKDYDNDNDEPDPSDPSWMATRLKFTTPIKDPQLDNYTVVDPLVGKSNRKNKK